MRCDYMLCRLRYTRIQLIEKTAGNWADKSEFVGRPMMRPHNMALTNSA